MIALLTSPLPWVALTALAAWHTVRFADRVEQDRIDHAAQERAAQAALRPRSSGVQHVGPVERLMRRDGLDGDDAVLRVIADGERT